MLRLATFLPTAISYHFDALVAISSFDISKLSQTILFLIHSYFSGYVLNSLLITFIPFSIQISHLTVHPPLLSHFCDIRLWFLILISPSTLRSIHHCWSHTTILQNIAFTFNGTFLLLNILVNSRHFILPHLILVATILYNP